MIVTLFTNRSCSHHNDFVIPVGTVIIIGTLIALVIAMDECYWYLWLLLFERGVVL